MSAITPLQALRRLVDVARLIDADECQELYNQLQAELAVAGAVLAEPQPDIHCQEFHELAMNYRGALNWGIVNQHYEALCNYINERIAPVAAEPAKHADDFAHFLSYSGLSAEPADVLEKMRRAFEAAQPVETQQPVAWRVTGNFTYLPFKNESSADAYMSGLLANDPDGGYKKSPLFAAPLPESGSAAPWESFEVEKTGDEYFDASNFLLNAAQEWWEASKRANVHGAVKWLDSEEGALLIYTRGEYKDVLMQNIHKLGQEPIRFVSAAPPCEVEQDAARYRWLRDFGPENKPAVMIEGRWYGAKLGNGVGFDLDTAIDAAMALEKK